MAADNRRSLKPAPPGGYELAKGSHGQPSTRLRNQLTTRIAMDIKMKFRIGDIVYHKTLELGRGRVRYIFRNELLVAFENSPAGRYPKEELCKSEPHPTTLTQPGAMARAA